MSVEHDVAGLAPPGRASRGPAGWVGSASINLAVGGCLVAAAVGTALLSVFWTPVDPNALNAAHRLAGPGEAGYLLGSDHVGRDILSQLMAGARTSMRIAGTGTAAGVLIGAVLGFVSASNAGSLDETLMRGADIVLAIPAVVLGLVLAAVLGPGGTAAVLAIGAFFVPNVARVTRGAALQILQKEFVTAARGYGRGRIYIVYRHVIPNTASVLLVQATILFGVAVLVEAALSYLGIGTQRPQVSWGMMLQEAQANVGVAGLQALWPGLAIVLTILGLNLLGDGLRDKFDPNLRMSER